MNTAPPLADNLLFQLKNQSLAYQQHTVFDDITLTIKAGEKVAIVGASGVGKTSLLKLLQPQQQNNIAFCPQQLDLISNLSAYNNIYSGRLPDFSHWKNLCNLISANKKQWQVITNIAHSLNIEQQLKKSISQLSGGQQQRVAIARALYQHKSIFFADEPVSNLDPTLAEQVLTLIVNQHDCCVVSLHDRRLALSHFDRIIGLKTNNLHVSAITLDQRSADLQLSDLDKLYL